LIIFNQFSGVLAYLGLGITLLVVILWRVPAERRRVGVLVGLAVLLFGGLFIFRPMPAGETAVTLQQTLATANGRPVLLELYSNY
jgi:hypothetical protein